MNKDIFGFLGAFFLTVTLLPQLYHSYKEKKMDDISKGFLGIQVLTCVCFLSYGILLNEIPLILANIIVLGQTIILIFFKLTFKTNKISTNI
tara:strand:- start:353 stop:628 length:276 start_codon:yes stop_codon:yes gene_type:complete